MNKYKLTATYQSFLHFMPVHCEFRFVEADSEFEALQGQKWERPEYYYLVDVEAELMGVEQLNEERLKTVLLSNNTTGTTIIPAGGMVEL